MSDEVQHAEIVGWSVHGGPISDGAFYNLSEREQAFEAARRWNAAITALIAHPDAPVGVR